MFTEDEIRSRFQTKSAAELRALLKGHLSPRARGIATEILGEREEGQPESPPAPIATEELAEESEVRVAGPSRFESRATAVEQEEVESSGLPAGVVGVAAAIVFILTKSDQLQGAGWFIVVIGAIFLGWTTRSVWR